MIRGIRPQQSGFTIIEVIIFLSISMALVAGTVVLFNTRIPRSQFSQGVNDLASKLSSSANDVANGFYPSTSNFTCTNGTISSGSTEQGKNAGCLFLGKAIQFAPNPSCTTIPGGDKCDAINVYTIYGRRVSISGASATSLAEASPNIGGIPPEKYTTNFGLYITNVFEDGNKAKPVGGIAYLQSFGAGKTGGSGDPLGASQLEVAPLPTTRIAYSPSTFASAAGLGGALNTNPNNGILVCLKSGVTKQFAVITIGSGRQPSAVTPEILSETEWNTRCA